MQANRPAEVPLFCVESEQCEHIGTFFIWTLNDRLSYLLPIMKLL